MLLARTRAEQLVDLIRRDIIGNVYPPGGRLTEEALAERYGVSRTPVREALRVLAREALLSHVPHTGYVVAAVDLDAMDDLYTVRVAIEEQVASRIVVAGAPGSLLDLLACWEGPATADDDVRLVFADEQFHETLAAASGSGVFAGMLRNINERLHVLRVRDFADPARVALTYAQHADIVRSLLAGDARLARAHLRAHIWSSHQFVREAARQALEGGTP